MARDVIRFLHRGGIVELSDVGPNETLLDYLRLRKSLRGTKEGCGEGDCGACTVVLGSLRDGTLIYEPINACIQLLGMIDGKELVVVEDLAEDGLHPVQQAMLDFHGSQCGFCTPGIVMSLFTLYHSNEVADRQAVNNYLAGNLCRCTGYRPIVDAGRAVCAGNADDQFAARRTKTTAQLKALDDDDDVMIGDEAAFFAAPATIDAFADLYARNTDAVIVAGATDVGLWITKQLRILPKMIHLGRVESLADIQRREKFYHIGAGATFAQVETALTAIDPDLGVILRRIGSKQVRAAGTLGGNIANGSPVGDTLPALIALGATLHLRQDENVRTLPLEDFFIEYGKQDRRPGEFVTAVDVPALSVDEVFRCYKLSKRFDQDISAVLGAFKFELREGYIVAARIAYGGMAATSRRAIGAEVALVGLRLADKDHWPSAIDALALDFQPIDDMRATAVYRLQTAQSLLLKALHEIGGTSSAEMRVFGLRPGEIPDAA